MITHEHSSGRNITSICIQHKKNQIFYPVILRSPLIRDWPIRSNSLVSLDHEFHPDHLHVHCQNSISYDAYPWFQDIHSYIPDSNFMNSVLFIDLSIQIWKSKFDFPVN